MNPSPATVAALLMVLAALFLIALTAIVVRPTPQRPVVRTQAAPGSPLRDRERAARRRQRRIEREVAERKRARPAQTPEPTAAPAPPAPAVAPAPVVPPEAAAPREQAAVVPPPQEPEAVVTAYYRALDAGRFNGAWALLTPAVRTSFGDFERWRAGYATTLSNLPRGIAVVRDGPRATVAHELVTEDRSPCGPLRRRFAVRWQLKLAADGWRAASLTAVERPSPEPAAACTARHDAGRGAGGR